VKGPVTSSRFAYYAQLRPDPSVVRYVRRYSHLLGLYNSVRLGLAYVGV